MMWAGGRRTEGAGGKKDSCWAQNCSIIVAKAVSIYISRSFLFCYFVLFIVMRLVRRTREGKRGERGACGFAGTVVIDMCKF